MKRHLQPKTKKKGTATMTTTATVTQTTTETITTSTMYTVTTATMEAIKLKKMMRFHWTFSVVEVLFS